MTPEITSFFGVSSGGHFTSVFVLRLVGSYSHGLVSGEELVITRPPGKRVSAK
jgi:hypothetical protein